MSPPHWPTSSLSSEHLGQLIRIVHRALAALETGTQMDTNTVSDGFDPSKYEAEAGEATGRRLTMIQKVALAVAVLYHPHRLSVAISSPRL